ncbi:MAG: hypothetical protein IPK53_09810 [bacterium]|nr:hypothetical protein [bacterium]
MFPVVPFQSPVNLASPTLPGANTSRRVWQAGVIEFPWRKGVSLTWEELDPGCDPSADKRPTVWEATQLLPSERINVHGVLAAALLSTKMSPELAANGRQLIASTPSANAKAASTTPMITMLPSFPGHPKPGTRRRGETMPSAKVHFD